MSGDGDDGMARHYLNTAIVDLLLALRPRDPRHILQAATHLHSQNYEDAIIAEIFARIGEGSRTFVEIGVGDGSECNTRALLERGWSGVWIEGDAGAAERARSNLSDHVTRGALAIVAAAVTRENVDGLVRECLGDRPVDFLSLDIDQNTSHAWRGLALRPRVACIEYNSSVPPTVAWEVPYRPDGAWDGTNRFGASLKTLEQIGRDKRLSLVGCDFHGVNAFFVADEECGDRFLAPHTAEQHFEPPRYGLIAHRGHPAPKGR